MLQPTPGVGGGHEATQASEGAASTCQFWPCCQQPRQIWGDGSRRPAPNHSVPLRVKASTEVCMRFLSTHCDSVWANRIKQGCTRKGSTRVLDGSAQKSKQLGAAIDARHACSHNGRKTNKLSKKAPSPCLSRQPRDRPEGSSSKEQSQYKATLNECAAKKDVL